jgi:hypothetical protein
MGLVLLGCGVRRGAEKTLRITREPERAAVPSLARNHDNREPRQKHCVALRAVFRKENIAFSSVACQTRVPEMRGKGAN